ncbi:MAG: cyclic-di-AMP receptor [Armatimonadetes bacterium]|nr:cyclic-di-AMP receptor [Armatimonadota bacterium]
MKLVIAVVHNRDKNKVVEDLVRAGFKFTIIGSTGGFLREGNTTFLIGVDQSEQSALLNLIQHNCKTREQLVNVLPPDASQVGTFVPSPIKVPVGGAIVFVLNVEQFERF